MTDILFESDRLYYREPTLGDVIDLHEAAVKVWPELRHWMVWTSMEEYTLQDAKEFCVDFTEDQRAKGGCWIFGFNKDNDDLVVSTGLAALDNEPHIYDTGYWVAKEYLGKGYATEATLAVLQYGFEKHGAEKISLAYYEGNDKSRRVIEKCGFDFVETIPDGHQSFATGEMMDEHVYAMTAEQWRQRP